MGLSTDQFHGTKMIGLTNESIGISGDGKLHFLKSDSQDAAISTGDTQFRLHKGSVIGVGYLFKTKEVIFTKDGIFIKKIELPKKMWDKLMYPALSLASRDHHRCQINLGMRDFEFSVDEYLQRDYYKKIYEEIK